MQPHEQIDFIKAIGQFVIDQTKVATAPLIARIEQLEKVISDMPVPVDGKDGAPGKDGKDAIFPWDEMNEQLSAGMEMLSEQLNKKIADLSDALKINMTTMVESLPKPKDGRDGTDGTDGKSLSVDEILPVVSGAVAKAVAELPVVRHVTGGFVDRFGNLSIAFSDGTFSDLGPVVGRDGANGKDGATTEQIAALIKQAVDDIPKPKDGRDGLGFKDMSVTFDGARNFIFKFVLDDRTEELSIAVPFVIYRGVWKAGKYEHGDSVTRDGSTFIALQDTETIPGTKDCHWQLACKRGQHGSQGERGAPGKDGTPGKDGRDGRDLTQLGPDGRKW